MLNGGAHYSSVSEVEPRIWPFVELSNPLILNGQAQIVNRKILGLGWPCEGGAIESADPVCPEPRPRARRIDLFL